MISEMRNSRREGFTLIEFLVVVSLIAVITAVIMVNFFSQNVRKKFDTSVENIVFSLNNARDRAVAWEKETTWGVFFERKMCGGSSRWSNYGIYFTNDGYYYPGKIAYRNTLPAAIDYNESTTWAGWTDPPGPEKCFRAISFSEVVGELRNVSNAIETSSVAIYLVNNQSVSSTISVSSFGVITYTTP